MGKEIEGQFKQFEYLNVYKKMSTGHTISSYIVLQELQFEIHNEDFNTYTILTLNYDK